MATINLLPNADVSNDWTLSTGSDVYALVDDDHAGTVASDSSYLSATAAGKTCTLDLQSFTEAHSSIDGVQLVVRAGNDGRSETYDLETILRPQIGSAYYTESTGTENANRYYLTHTFTNRTTYDGSNAWTNFKVNSLRIVVTLDALSGGTMKFTQAYVIVTYTEPLAADDAIFFGTNF
jgi:hypothetical protein